MQKIVISKETNEVLQIINLDIDDKFSDGWYPDCYIIDDENNEINSYGLTYNKELEIFEEVEGYVEFETIVLPTEFETLSGELLKKDEELLELKVIMATMSEEKDSEILDLKLAIAELVEGGL